jgi:D-proline reductase (dithiol) PrdB
VTASGTTFMINDIRYMERTRKFYRAQGYESDYVWAHFPTTPFMQPTKPLQESRVVAITTSMPNTEIGRSNRSVYSNPINPHPQSMYTEELSWDKKATHTNDIASFLPLEQLEILAAEGFIGSVSPRFHCLPTEFSQKTTLEKDAPEILARCKKDKADLAILVPL